MLKSDNICNLHKEITTQSSYYVEKVSNKHSEHFIPQEDRIAVFDLDGTLYCETFPIYGEWLLFSDYVLNNPEFNDKEEILNILEDESYQEIKDLAFEAFLNFKNDSDFIYFMQRSVASKVNKKEQFTLFLGILELLFKDSLLDNLSIFENEELKLSYEKDFRNLHFRSCHFFLRL